MQLSALSLLALLAAAQAGFFALTLIGRQPKRRGEGWLSLILLSLAMEMLALVYYDAEIYRHYPALIGLDSASSLLYGPLLWLFMRAATDDKENLRFSPGWHFLPFLLLTLLSLNARWTLPTDELPTVLLREVNAQASSSETLLLDGCVYAQAALYIGLAWRLLNRYRERVKREHAQLYSSHLRLFRGVLHSFSLLWLLGLLSEHLFPALGWRPLAAQAIPGLFAGVVFLLSFVILRYPPLRLVLPGSRSQETLSAPPREDRAQAQQEEEQKYQRSAIDEALARQVFALIEQGMRDEQLWKNPELDLSALAEHCGLTPHHVSQAINTGAERNFYDYINQYRVEDVKAGLAQALDKRSILDLALAAGFNSKSAFYSAFKRHAGGTPSQFRAQHFPTTSSPAPTEL